MRPRSKAQAYFANQAEPGSIASTTTKAELAAFRQWLKQEDRDRHYMERSARRDGWTVTTAGTGNNA